MIENIAYPMTISEFSDFLNKNNHSILFKEYKNDFFSYVKVKSFIYKIVNELGYKVLTQFDEANYNKHILTDWDAILSPGEKQIISIIRAVLKNPNMVK